MSTLSRRQRDIVNYLLDNNSSTRSKLLPYLFSRYHFDITYKNNKTKRLSYKSADRILRAEINDIILKGVPICAVSSNKDGYFIASTSKEIERAIAEAESRCAEIKRVKIAGLRRAASVWLAIPIKKQPSNKIKIALNQLALFPSGSCVAEAFNYIPEGRH